MSDKANKIQLPVSRDKWGWFKHSKAVHGTEYRVQLAGDVRQGWFWLQQYAEQLGYHDFMKQFNIILAAVDRDNQKLREKNLYPIAIFNLYVSEEHRQ